jgi:sterol desaturase/sphingolipid hydroxylase (fatty acid hydroxylase superfamily)
MEEVKQKQSKLRILFRLAFICNVFFIVCIIMRYTSAPQYIPQPLIELSVILGWFAPLINFINFVLALILLSRLRTKQIPLWLLYTNIICFILQIYFFFILHDTPYS